MQQKPPRFMSPTVRQEKNNKIAQIERIIRHEYIQVRGLQSKVLHPFRTLGPPLLRDIMLKIGL